MTPLVTDWCRSGPPPVRLSLRWTSPAGASRTGEITAAESVAPGTTMTVWIDGQGRLTPPPLSRAEVIGRVIGAAVAAPVAVALLLAAVARVASPVLDKRRLASWEADWSTVEPQWTGRQ